MIRFLLIRMENASKAEGILEAALKLSAENEIALFNLALISHKYVYSVCILNFLCVLKFLTMVYVYLVYLVYLAIFRAGIRPTCLLRRSCFVGCYRTRQLTSLACCNWLEYSMTYISLDRTCC
jgi:hypothetical protein